MDRGDDPNFLFTFQKTIRPSDGGAAPEWIFNREDAFDVRNDFLAIGTPDQALAFFRHYGPWQVKERYAMEAAPFKWSQVQRMRGLFEQALLVAHPSDLGDSEIQGTMERFWMWQNLAVELPYREPLVAFSRCDDIQTALRASVYLSRLAGLEWNRCAKTDCNKLFQRNSKREQLYCCTEHANVQSTRNYKQRIRKVSAPAGRMRKA